jgi:pyruvate dehydrogenase E2 component (dihydrolipoamide acetyltransferase)
MPTTVTMPVLGLTMEEGTIAEWLKREGDVVVKDEPLFTVETDKAVVEVPAPASGVLRAILLQPGETAPIRAPIAEIADAAAVASSPTAVGEDPRRGDEGLPRSEERVLLGDRPSPGRNAFGSRPPSPVATGEDGRRFVSPRARLRARELGVDLRRVTGTGFQGRVIERDVLAAGPARRVVATPLAQRVAADRGVAIEEIAGSGPGGRVTRDDVLAALPSNAPAPLSRMRRLTAERMAASARSVARVTLFLDADLDEAARFRAQLAPEFARLGVPKLPWDALIAKAVGMALAEHPALNASWVEGEGIRRHAGVHVGVATALDPEGLIVPVLRDADRRPLRELTSDLLALVEKARAGRLGPAEIGGSTFTITNLGAYRIEAFTPIVNPPEAAILGVGRIAEKPAVVEGQLSVRTRSMLSLSFDHRVVDGAPAAAFFERLAQILERPYALLGI